MNTSRPHPAGAVIHWAGPRGKLGLSFALLSLASFGCAATAARLELGHGYEARASGRCDSSSNVEFGSKSHRCVVLYHGGTRIGESYWHSISPSGRYLAFEEFGNLYVYNRKRDTVSFLSAHPFRSCMDKWYEDLTPPVIRCFDIHAQTVREVSLAFAASDWPPGRTCSLVFEDGKFVPIPDASISKASLDLALEQVVTRDPNSVISLPATAESMNSVLLYLQGVASRPIVAMTEYRGWYWFATSATEDGAGISTYLEGYAVRWGSREAVSWSVW